jgi:hypothetical protein
MMRTYYAMLLERGEDDSVGKMKQFATYFTHGVRTARSCAPRSTRRRSRGDSRSGGRVLPAESRGRRLTPDEEGPSHHRRRLPRQPRPGGWAASCGTTTKKEMWGSEPHTTNNRMELRAAIEGCAR